jgi:hypothetical protein
MLSSVGPVSQQDLQVLRILSFAQESSGERLISTYPRRGLNTLVMAGTAGKGQLAFTAKIGVHPKNSGNADEHSSIHKLQVN